MAQCTLLFVFGTRPEAIKLAPLVLAARAHGGFTVRVCVTAQHRDMLDSVLSFFGIRPDFDLDLMRAGQTLAGVTSGALAGLAPVLAAVRPRWAVVQGHTCSAFAGALAAFYAGVRVAHVEAGLRSGNIDQPFPEEMNRKLVGAIAALHFAPSAPARANLLREGVDPARIVIAGDTGLDALALVRDRLRHDPLCRAQARAALAAHGLERDAGAGRPLVVVTAHRRESFGAGIDAICAAVGELCARHPGADFVFPVHPNPAVRRSVARRLAPLQADNLTLCAPLAYLPFVALLGEAALVLTDSGGLQEEALSLGTPVVAMRDCSDSAPAHDPGLLQLAGADRARIVGAVSALLAGGARAGAPPAADGQAARRIVAAFARLGAAS